MKQAVRCIAFTGLLFGTFAFGLLGQATEMGLMIVASAVALAFTDIDRFSSFEGGGFKAQLRDLKERVDVVVEQATEPPADIEDDHASPLGAKLDGTKATVLNALISDRFAWRYLSGVMKETALPKREVLEALAWLVENGYARRSQGRSGPIWGPTEDGRFLGITQNFDDA